MGAVPPGKIRVTVTDEDGNTETADVGPHDYVLLTVGACELANTQAYANGTHVLTIKGRR